MPPRITASLAREMADRLSKTFEALLQIRARLAEVSRDMADRGVIPPPGALRVVPGDSREIASLKELAISLQRRRKEIRRRLEVEGAVIVNDETLELVMPAEPGEDFYLSWQPGEPAVAWWRAAADDRCPRLPLETGDGAPERPSLH